MTTTTEDLSATVSAETQTHRLDDGPVAPKEKRTPLPILQLSIIALIQFSEPVTADMVYPFVNQFVRSTGVTKGDEKATGYYAGIIESIFFVAEGVTALAWQRASDRFGRRPILLLAPLGLGLSMLGFGLSKAFWSLVVARCFQGAFNGNIGVSKTVMGEISDATNRARIFSLTPVIWSVGTFLAPFIGGVFSFPAKHWPNTIGKIQFFQEYPFFLPCAISATICFITFFLTVIGLKETAPAVLRRQKKAARARASESQRLLDGPVAEYGTTNSSTSSISEHDDYDEQVEPPSIRDLMTRPILTVLMNYGLFAFIDMCAFALQPLIWSTSIENGGLGFTALTIGTINTVFGLPNAIFQILALSRILEYFGPRKIAIASFTSILFYLLAYPIENYFARQAGGADWRVWVVVTIQLLFQSMLFSGYASLSMFLIEVSPSPAALGTIQGLGQTAAVICRAVSPATATSLFALSTERNLLNGNLVFVVLGILNLAAIWVSLTLPHIKH